MVLLYSLLHQRAPQPWRNDNSHRACVVTFVPSQATNPQIPYRFLLLPISFRPIPPGVAMFPRTSCALQRSEHSTIFDTFGRSCYGRNLPASNRWRSTLRKEMVHSNATLAKSDVLALAVRHQQTKGMFINKNRARSLCHPNALHF